MAALAVTLLTAACSAAAGNTTSAHPPETAITVAAEPGIDDAPLYIAEKDGLFKKVGLKVTIKTFGSAAGDLAALRSGRASIGFGDYVDYFYAQDVKPGLLAVADGYDAAPGVVEVLSLPGSGIYTPQDLANKVIGTAAPQGIRTSKDVPYSIATVATESVLQNDGVDTDPNGPGKVTFKAMPAQDLVNALAKHQVDAILVTEPYIYEAESGSARSRYSTPAAALPRTCPWPATSPTSPSPRRTPTPCWTSGRRCWRRRPSRCCRRQWTRCWPTSRG